MDLQALEFLFDGGFRRQESGHDDHGAHPRWHAIAQLERRQDGGLDPTGDGAIQKRDRDIERRDQAEECK